MKCIVQFALVRRFNNLLVILLQIHIVQLYISNIVDIRRKLFFFSFIVIQEVNHRVGRNQIDVVDIGGGLKVKMKE